MLAYLVYRGHGSIPAQSVWSLHVLPVSAWVSSRCSGFLAHSNSKDIVCVPLITYQHSRVNQWSSSVVENCLGQLTKLGKPFKYIVTCIIMQKNGAGLQTATSCFWDNTTDGSCTVRWENKSMYCIVSVFGLAI
uniref:Dynein light chain Tctex-type 1 n=1 Tax=Scleropages formosus TaxID=113540 RepID=A0A8C9RYB6_SCLFO